MGAIILFIFFNMISNTVNGAEIDLSAIPCKQPYTQRSDTPIDYYKYGTNGTICVIESYASISTPGGPSDTPDEISVNVKENMRSHCGNFAYNKTESSECSGHGICESKGAVPLKDSGSLESPKWGNRGNLYSIGTSNGDARNDMPDAFNGEPAFYVPEQEYQIKVLSDIVGGVARRLYASKGEILSSTKTGTTGGKNGLCFDANEITTELVTFTWKAPKGGAGDVLFQSLVGSANAGLILFKDSCGQFRTSYSDCGPSYRMAPPSTKVYHCCAMDAPSNITNAAPELIFVGEEPILIKESFIAKPSEIGAGTDGGLLTLIILGSVVFLIIIALIFAWSKKKHSVDDDDEEDIDEDEEEGIELSSLELPKGNSSDGKNEAPKRKRWQKKRSWIQKVARRANEFGRQVPENIQIEEEVYDDFIDTFMTVILWILLIGILLFTIIDEYTNPVNMSVAFCSENRASYCNQHYSYDKLGNCNGEAGDAVGQADASARTSMCGLRSNGDHLLSILTNYGALSGLVTALCRYIANTWKGCRKKKRFVASV
jgi:hypothetical protein